MAGLVLYEGVATRFQGVRDSESRHDSSRFFLFQLIDFGRIWLILADSESFWLILTDFGFKIDAFPSDYCVIL